MLLGIAVKGVAVSIERGADVGMPENMLEHLRRHTSLDTARRIGMPLRYNNDKRENPVFKGISTFVAVYSIPFPKLIIGE